MKEFVKESSEVLLEEINSEHFLKISRRISWGKHWKKEGIPRPHLDFSWTSIRWNSWFFWIFQGVPAEIRTVIFKDVPGGNFVKNFRANPGRSFCTSRRRDSRYFFFKFLQKFYGELLELSYNEILGQTLEEFLDEFCKKGIFEQLSFGGSSRKIFWRNPRKNSQSNF